MSDQDQLGWGTDEESRRAAANRRTRIVRQLITIAIGLGLIAIVALLPDLTPPIANGGDVIEAYHGRIVSVQPAPTDPNSEQPPVPVAQVTMLDGPQAGQTISAYLSGPGGSEAAPTYLAGDEVVVTISATPGSDQPFVAVSDRWRLPGLGLLVFLFAAAVIVVGGWHGVRALIALGLTIVVILKILLPLLVAGYAPVPLAVITATVITIVSIVMTEGWDRPSLAAILGTTGALAITGLLGAVFTTVLGFTYIAGSDLAFFTLPGGQGLDLRGILLAAIIIGAVGVLDDVTVTQAVLVEQLADVGGIHGRALVVRAMTVGRSHIAATVNTLFLAYVGAGLPLLVVLLVSAQPTALVLNDEVIATEVVRTLVGSLGIIAAIPLTTFIAASIIARAPTADGEVERTRPVGVIAAAIGIVGLLVLTAALPLTGGPRRALVPDTFDPNAIPSFEAGGPIGSEEPIGSDEPFPTDEPLPSGEGDLEIFEANQPVPVSVAGQEVGTFSVLDWTVENVGDGSGDQAITVHIHCEAETEWVLGSGSWAMLADDGTQTALLPLDDPTALEATLQPTDTADLTLVAQYAKPVSAPFIVYVDDEGAVRYALPLD